jgi:predicted RNA binding protein YcfA (HicA-like mRNA interferase family)
MKIPRDISGSDLVKLLKKYFDYEPTRQVGSHIRISTQRKGEHHITIPNHNPIKIGTLSGIIKDVADHFEITKSEVYGILFE